LSIDWDTALYDPIFGIFGVVAAIDTGAVQANITVIDQTAGIDIGQDVERPVISPAVYVRAAEIAENGLTDESLLEATLTLRGIAWTVKNVAARPGPDGKNSGEFVLLLINGEL
jgi:hypothetical protein